MPEITTWQNSPLNAAGCALSCTFTADFARDRGFNLRKAQIAPLYFANDLECELEHRPHLLG